MSNKTKGKPNDGAMNVSNVVRSLILTMILVCFGAFLITNMNYGAAQKKEVPISEEIQRANDPEGDIEKITVTGNTLDITVKGQNQPTETSRKDGAGTLLQSPKKQNCLLLSAGFHIALRQIHGPSGYQTPASHPESFPEASNTASP